MNNQNGDVLLLSTSQDGYIKYWNIKKYIYIIY